MYFGAEFFWPDPKDGLKGRLNEDLLKLSVLTRLNRPDDSLRV
jgi:hypothetical protein